MKKVYQYIDKLVWPMVAILMYLACQFMGQATVQTVAFLNHSNDPVGDSLAWALTISSIVSIIAMVVLPPYKILDDYKRVGCSKKNVAIAMVVLMLTLIFATALNDKVDRVFGLEMGNEYEKIFNTLIKSPVGLIAICLLGPVCEEIVFRGGVMKPLLQRKVKPWTAIWVSAIIFAVVHGNLVQMLYALMVGLVMGIIYYRTASLILTSIAHIINNSVSAWILLNHPEWNDLNPETIFGPLMYYVLLVVLAVAVVMLLRHFWYKTSDMKRKFEIDNIYKL